jgi:diguanylate cyclase (GGDEF)-like protein
LDAIAFISLINPGMSLVFAGAFFLLWRDQRERIDVAIIAASFLVGTVAFTFQYFIIYSEIVSRLISNFCFLASGFGIMAGTVIRFGCKPPLVPALVVAGTGWLTFLWAMFVEPNMTGRILAINFAFGTMIVMMVLSVRRAPRKFHFVDKLLVGLSLFWGLTYFVRPLLTMALEGQVESSNFHMTLYWTTMSVASSMFLLLFAMSMITAIALDVMQDLRHESRTDPLSGLLNRRGLEASANEMMRLAKRKRTTLAVVVCDLDHFKDINDTFGHATGDNVIAAFAACLRGCVGPKNIVARLGGEEFAVVLDGADTVVARLFAESTRTTFGVLKVASLPPERRVSSSFGVAEWQPGEGLDTLLARADKALYEAKRAGRDCVRIAKPVNDMIETRPAVTTVAA